MHRRNAAVSPSCRHDESFIPNIGPASKQRNNRPDARVGKKTHFFLISIKPLLKWDPNFLHVVCSGAPRAADNFTLEGGKKNNNNNNIFFQLREVEPRRSGAHPEAVFLPCRRTSSGGCAAPLPRSGSSFSTVESSAAAAGGEEGDNQSADRYSSSSGSPQIIVPPVVRVKPCAVRGSSLSSRDTRPRLSQ